MNKARSPGSPGLAELEEASASLQLVRDSTDAFFSNEAGLFKQIQVLFAKASGHVEWLLSTEQALPDVQDAVSIS